MSSYANDPAHADTHASPDSGSTPSHLDAHANAAHDDNEDPTKKKKQGKRRKVNHACLYCRRSHMTCDEGRPCQRWCARQSARPFYILTAPHPAPHSIKREIGHLCHDERRSTPKDKTPVPTAPAPVPNPPVDVARALPGKHSRHTLLPMPVLLTMLLDLHSGPVRPRAVCARPQPCLAEHEHRAPERLPLPARDPRQRVLCPLVRALRFSCVPLRYVRRLTLIGFSDFLESLDEGSFFDQSASGPSLIDTSPYPNPLALAMDNSYLPTSQPPTDPAPPAPEKPPEEPPVVLPAATKTERFFLTAADQASGTRNERLNMVIRSKYEAGLLKPYNYVKGYARLSRWMDKK